jgi:hypothetical protein
METTGTAKRIAVLGLSLLAEIETPLKPLGRR